MVTWQAGVSRNLYVRRLVVESCTKDAHYLSLVMQLISSSYFTDLTEAKGNKNEVNQRLECSIVQFQQFGQERLKLLEIT